MTRAKRVGRSVARTSADEKSRTTAPVVEPLTEENTPRRFYDGASLNVDLGIESADELWEWIEAETLRGAIARGEAASPNGATAEAGTSRDLPVGAQVVYRGQANAGHGLTSSLYRLVRKGSNGERVDEPKMAKAESAILASMRGQGIGRRMSSLELLAVLQHHGIPTRLIDFSETLHEALFFAVDRDDAAPGRLFVVEIHDDGYEIVESQDPLELPWKNALRGSVQSTSGWTSTVARVPVSDLDPRMRAQRGTFLAGGLNRRYRGRSMRVDGSNLSAAAFSDTSSLSINFINQRRAKRTDLWGATGWNIRVEPEWKPVLRTRLAAMADPISFDTMYPPLTEVKRLAIVAASATLGSC